MPTAAASYTAGAAPSETTFGAAETARRRDAATAMELSFGYFVGPQKYSVAVKKLLTSVQATKTGDVNVCRTRSSRSSRTPPEAGGGRCAVVHVHSIPAAGTDRVFVHLEGEEGLHTEERIGFEVDGVEVKGRLGFGAKAIDFRGLYKNPGILTGSARQAPAPDAGAFPQLFAARPPVSSETSHATRTSSSMVTSPSP